MRIAIVSDAWRPQINGVVRTIETVAQLLRADGHDVEVFGPDRFRTLPCPTYPEIRLSLFPGARLAHMLKLYAPDAIHLVTEGPLGWAARNFCLARDIPFTTAYHTRFPEYVHARIRLPVSWSYAFVRRFHAPSSAVLVVAAVHPRRAHRARLQEAGAVVARRRHHGLPAAPAQRRPCEGRPIWLYAGRVAIEKNIKAFLDLDLPGTKWVVGGGPQLKELKRRYQDVHFFGSVDTEELGAALRRGRLLRLPQPHRHVRPGDGRGAGLAACRSRAIRCRARSTWLPIRKSARSTRICVPPASPP